ncbi:MAG TPA: acetoacetate decarboxylase family protein [Archangium sp.]|nr:acetoacetate decarboxylase family protein [Archangium sp.]
MTQQTELAEVPFPPAPWRMSGECWVGLFQADRDVPCPAPWKPMFSARTVMVALMRYQEGTLQYDELMVGPLVRHGLHMGLWVSHIWVTSVASLWGGRRMWSLPKELATFTWEEGRVRVADASGPIATFGVERRAGFGPSLPVPMPGIGGAPGGWTTFVGRMSGRLAKGGLRVEDWSERFPFLLGGDASFSVRAHPMSLTVPAPTVVTAF